MAHKARQKSDDIVAEFNRVSASLDTTYSYRPYSFDYAAINGDRSSYARELLQKADTVFKAACDADTFFERIRIRIEPIVAQTPDDISPVLSAQEIVELRQHVLHVAAVCYAVAKDDALRHDLDSIFKLEIIASETAAKASFANLPAVANSALLASLKNKCDEGSKMALMYVRRQRQHQ